MNRDEFMEQLEYLLSDIPEEEKEDALAYYRDYLEEAGEGAGEAIREFGSPERIASIIRSDLAGNLEEGGQFTDRGYDDERFRDPNYQVSKRLDLPETLPYSCDPDKLARVFDNLLRNACHYSEAGTAVAIAAQVEEGETVLTFTNTGVTIPPDKLGRIFEQFFRLDSSRASRTGGAGLGLAIAREIVELHGGTIAAQSQDGVTTFTVRLPAS